MKKTGELELAHFEGQQVSKGREVELNKSMKVSLGEAKQALEEKRRSLSLVRQTPVSMNESYELTIECDDTERTLKKKD